jgi:hypothetical protein
MTAAGRVGWPEINGLVVYDFEPRLYGRGEAEGDGEVEGDGEAEGDAGGEALADGDAALGEAVVAGTVRSKVFAGPVALGVTSEPVCSVRAGGSDGSVGSLVRSSRNAESNVERVMAATIAPKSTTGASAAVKGNSVHGELPAWVRTRTR